MHDHSIQAIVEEEVEAIPATAVNGRALSAPSHRLEIQEMLIEIAQTLSSTDEVDFDELLQKVGAATGAQGVYLQQIPAGDHFADVLTETTRLDFTAWWSNDAARPDSGPPDAQGFREWLESSSLEVLAVPILSARNQLHGYIGIAYDTGACPRRREDQRVLNMLGDMLATYFERSIARKSLQESEERWRKLVECHPEPILIVHDDRIAYVSPSGVRLFGARHPEDLLGRPLLDFDSADEHDRLLSHLHNLSEHQAAAPAEYEIIGLDGQWRIVECVAAPIVFDDRPAVQMVLRDITERKRNEQRYHTFVQTISEGIWCIELRKPVSTATRGDLLAAHVLAHGYLSECNEVMTRMLGRPLPEQPIGALPEGLPWDATFIDAFVRAGYALRSYEQVISDGDGGTTHLVVNAVGTVERGHLVRIWGSCIDVTERIELERHAVAALERQQQFIGRELHHGVGQYLTSIRMMTTVLAESISGPEQSTASRVLHFTEEAMRQLRNIYSGLAPTQLGSEGLAAVLQDLANNIHSIGRTNCRFVHDGETDVWNAEAKLHLYRIAQEATHNALKHSGAGEITVSLVTESDQVVLCIKDNGTGFEELRPSKRSLGINSMHYRARTVGGNLEIASQTGQGTMVRCLLPKRRLEKLA